MNRRGCDCARCGHVRAGRAIVLIKHQLRPVKSLHDNFDNGNHRHQWQTSLAAGDYEDPLQRAPARSSSASQSTKLGPEARPPPSHVSPPSPQPPSSQSHSYTSSDPKSLLTILARGYTLIWCFCAARRTSFLGEHQHHNNAHSNAHLIPGLDQNTTAPPAGPRRNIMKYFLGAAALLAASANAQSGAGCTDDNNNWYCKLVDAM